MKNSTAENIKINEGGIADIKYPEKIIGDIDDFIFSTQPYYGPSQR